MEHLYVAENITKCPLTRGVRPREVSVSGGSAVFLVWEMLSNICCQLVNLKRFIMKTSAISAFEICYLVLVVLRL